MTLPVNIAVLQYHHNAQERTAAENQDEALHLLHDAAHTADLVLMPESSFAAYHLGMDITGVAEPERSPSSAVVSQIAVTRNTYVCYSIIERDGDRFHKTAILVSADGRVLGKQRKIHLTEADRQAGFSAGDSLQIFTTHLGKIGILICGDVRDHRKIHDLDVRGVQMVLIPCNGWVHSSDAINEGAGRWESALRDCARHGRLVVAWSTKFGTDGPFTAVGNSMVLDPDGNVVARAAADIKEIISASVTLPSKDLQAEPEAAA